MRLGSERAATVDFFEAQSAAHRRTGVLVGLFGLAVLAIIAVVYAVAHAGVGPRTATIDPILLIQVVVGVGLVIALGSAIRTASLRRGGPAVAELLGGRRVPSDTREPAERKLINVVEEMSIAAGTPVPAVYVLDGEDGINAFAAGYTTHDAAVAVTRGTLRSLTRDELQGVMAHEFSHILNGDMRLNIRLMGVLYGILLLAVVGRGIVHLGPRGGSRRRDSGGGAWVALLGLTLLLVGYIGVFFGKIIKAAVSRQREYLADAAAVQFTRNPHGITGALKKIGGQAHGSRIDDHHAEELSHMFFANGLRGSLFGVLATHPPLEARIRRLDPAWDGSWATPPPPAGAEPVPGVADWRGAAAPPPAAAAPSVMTPGALMASIGAPTAEHLAYAAALLARFPEALTQAVHDPVESRALILALVSAGSGTGAEPLGAAESGALRGYGGEELERRVESLVPLVRAQGADAPLALLDLALPALLHLSPEEAERFREAVERLIRADGRVRPFDFALAHTLARRLQADDRQAERSRSPSGAALRVEAAALVSAVAWAGSGDDAAAAQAAFEEGARRLPPSSEPLRLQEPAAVGLPRLDTALSALEGASPRLRRMVLEAAAECAAHDGRLHTKEAELLRAIAEALDCPIPPALGPRLDRSAERPHG
jgi:Zn-dependent protease with chaperone function